MGKTGGRDIQLPVPASRSKDKQFGGDCGRLQHRLHDIQRLQRTHGAFAALHEDGDVTVWGHADYGGDASSVSDQLKDVCEIQATESAFAAIKDDRRVVAWGAYAFGGACGAVRSFQAQA